MELFIPGFGIGIAIAFILLVPFCYFSVAEGHVASLETFGKAERAPDGTLIIHGPGIHKKKPWQKANTLSVMERIIGVSKDQHTYSTLARDGSTLHLKSKIRIQADPKLTERLLYGVENPIRQVRNFLACSLSGEVAKFGEKASPGDVFLHLRKQKREFLESFSKNSKDHLVRVYGIDLVGVDLIDITPPDELAGSLNSVQTARADADALVAKAEATREKMIYSASENLIIARSKAQAAETEIRVLSEKLAELKTRGSLSEYVDRRKNEVYHQARVAVVKRESQEKNS
jgi:regulator of protease activity HflC (stomatin/prohibitin superfamily)